MTDNQKIAIVVLALIPTLIYVWIIISSYFGKKREDKEQAEDNTIKFRLMSDEECFEARKRAEKYRNSITVTERFPPEAPEELNINNEVDFFDIKEKSIHVVEPKPEFPPLQDIKDGHIPKKVKKPRAKKKKKQPEDSIPPNVTVVPIPKKPRKPRS